MSGIPRPVTDLPAGHVSVRLIRGQLSNNIQGHPVEMHAGGKVLTVKTDENGRAEFSGVAAGTTVKAVAVVDGERLESQEFPWPGDSGIRVMLVATPKGGGEPPPVFQPVTGNVAFGDQTRIIIDPARRFASGVLPARHSKHGARTGQPAFGAQHRHAGRREQRNGSRWGSAGGRPRRSCGRHWTVCARANVGGNRLSHAVLER